MWKLYLKKSNFSEGNIKILTLSNFLQMSEDEEFRPQSRLICWSNMNKKIFIIWRNL